MVLQNINNFSYLTHDEGSSVGLAFLDSFASIFEIQHHYILDGSIYLPAASITAGQKALLSNLTGPAIQALMNPNTMAKGLGTTVCTPKLNETQTAALASVFGYQEGQHIMHDTIQYLVDRKLHEDHWLDVLHNAQIDASLIWGTTDPVATTKVADYVWENYLKNRPHANATYHKIQGANHYLQIGNATQVAAIVLQEPL